MTRKDYVAIAEAIARAARFYGADELANGRVAVRNVAVYVADVLAADNPRFDRGRFLMAARA